MGCIVKLGILCHQKHNKKSRNLGIAEFPGWLTLHPQSPTSIRSSSILVVFHFGRLPFWSFSILVVFHFGRLTFGRLPFGRSLTWEGLYRPSQVKDLPNGRRPNVRRPKWKTTKMENDQNGRRPKWKTTKMEDDKNGRRPKWKTNKMEDDQR